MLKSLAVVGLLAFGLCGAWSQVPSNAGKQEKDAQKQQQDSKPVQPTPVATHAQDEASEQKGGSEQKPAKYPWGELLAPANIPNWVLVIVAAFTGGVVCWQSRETRRAAQSAERQIELQSIAMRQWVNIDPIGTVTPPKNSTSLEVTFQFEVRNRTDYLITIKKIVAEAFYGGVAKIFTVSCSVPVPPERSSADGGHPFFVNVLVDRSTWGPNGALVSVGGNVTYLDCTEIERSQSFHDLFHGYQDGRLLRKKPSGLVPEVADYQAEEQQTEEDTT
jgi:hypothetical protein